MSVQINCPNCGQTVQPQMRFCEHCGVDLEMAVVLAEQEALLPIQPVSGLPIAPEVLVPRIGEYMTQRKLIKPEDLKRALSYQKEKTKIGSPILLGQAMLELGLVDRETLDQVVRVKFNVGLKGGGFNEKNKKPRKVTIDPDGARKFFTDTEACGIEH